MLYGFEMSLTFYETVIIGIYNLFDIKPKADASFGAFGFCLLVFMVYPGKECSH